MTWYRLRRRLRRLPWYSCLVAALAVAEVILYLIPATRPAARHMAASVYWLIAHDHYRE